MVLFEIVWVAREIYAASLRHGGRTSLPGLHYNSSHPVRAGLRAGHKNINRSFIQSPIRIT